MRRSERSRPSGVSTCEWARSYTLDRPKPCLLRVSRDAVKGSVCRASSYQRAREPSRGGSMDPFVPKCPTSRRSLLYLLRRTFQCKPAFLARPAILVHPGYMFNTDCMHWIYGLDMIL